MIKLTKIYSNAEMGFFFLSCTIAELEVAEQLVQKLNACYRVAVVFLWCKLPKIPSLKFQLFAEGWVASVPLPCSLNFDSFSVATGNLWPLVSF